jgi:hypothetical protein
LVRKRHQRGRVNDLSDHSLAEEVDEADQRGRANRRSGT